MQQIKQKHSLIFQPLSKDEKNVIIGEMQQDAVANGDFYVLILLSASIAIFGLLQNSSAVIIGAMLVAPLMSPMMAMGFGIVNGNFPLFRQATASTLLGIALAIGISTVITVIFPIQTATTEILSRANPNILDLFIAIVAGLAGAYALCRKDVSASLPGVAISASLVPPLCVVGFGIGYGNSRIALNALLLFTTNLAGIVVASILVFWWSGFRPKTVKNQQVFYRTTYFSLLTLLLIAIPLTVYTIQSTLQTQRLNAVRSVLDNEINPEVAAVEDVVVEAIEDGYVVGMTVYIYDTTIVGDENAQRAAVEAMRQQLETAVNGPVTVRAQVIPASLNVFENPNLKLREVQPLMVPNGEP